MNATCTLCSRSAPPVDPELGVCAECIRRDFDRAEPLIRRAHERSRAPFGLPAVPPNAPGGRTCTLCANACRIPEGGTGFCGLRRNVQGRLIHLGGTVERGILGWYHDPLPTNCVADWVCPGGGEAGYPEFSYARGPERGYKNLAVFYAGCSFDCLFCQNWHHRRLIERGEPVSAEELGEAVDGRTACICYFGGDPTPHLPHAIRTSEIALDRARGRILRICWETNGSMSWPLLRRVAELSLRSGGCVKFDLKAWSEEVHIALTGASNRRTLENFRLLAGLRTRRPDPPLLVASTLLVPGYVDVEEISGLARFIASLGSDIPYALLAFHPQFRMSGLPVTSRSHAQDCLNAARNAGLTNVRIGNVHLLS